MEITNTLSPRQRGSDCTQRFLICSFRSPSSSKKGFTSAWRWLQKEQGEQAFNTHTHRALSQSRPELHQLPGNSHTATWVFSPIYLKMSKKIKRNFVSIKPDTGIDTQLPGTGKHQLGQDRKAKPGPPGKALGTSPLK